jgi:phosphotransacetylase
MHKARNSSPKKRVVFVEVEETKIIRAAAQVYSELRQRKGVLRCKSTTPAQALAS